MSTYLHTVCRGTDPYQRIQDKPEKVVSTSLINTGLSVCPQPSCIPLESSLLSGPILHPGARD